MCLLSWVIFKATDNLTRYNTNMRSGEIAKAFVRSNVLVSGRECYSMTTSSI